jgi:hypothetical protein
MTAVRTKIYLDAMILQTTQGFDGDNSAKAGSHRASSLLLTWKETAELLEGELGFSKHYID